jgi:ABC-type molybdate transport system ATPase subunit
MKNISMKVTKNGKNKLVVEILDLEADFGKSGSGKTTIVASTGGNVSLPAPYEHIKIGINVYKK